MEKEPKEVSLVIGGLSFIPLIGVLFGIFAILYGLITKKRGGKKLAIMGAAGIGFTVMAYSALFYFGFVQRGGVFDSLRTQLAEQSLVSTVQAIEFYKIQNGEYPPSLEILEKSYPAGSNASLFVRDSSVSRGAQTMPYFYYELVDGEHYYLLGTGPDGVPFTQDDILPKIQVKPSGKSGFLVKTP